MSQFTINGITFEDDKDSLQHGLGVGGGRGRPKGSRNGYINPNAAYMKGYEIKGEVAQPVLGAGNGIERPNAMGAGSQIGRSSSVASRVTRPTTAPRISVQSRRNSGGGSGGSTTRNNTVAGAARNATVNNMVADIDNVGNLEGSNDSKRVGSLGSSSNPAASVQNGKSFLEKALGATEQAVANFGDSVNDTLHTVDQWWNGSQKEGTDVYGSPEKRAARQEGHTQGVRKAADEFLGNTRETIEETLEGAGDTAKEWWEGFLNWGEQAWKDVSKAATSAIDTGKGWAKSGFDWVNNNIINPVGKWGETAVSDVGNWIGERGRDLDRWWNGYEAQKSDLYGSPENRERRQSGVQEGDHVNGFRENAANWLDQAGRDIGRTATDVGNWIGDRGRDIAAVPGQVGNWFDERGQDFNRWWNGYDVAPTGDPDARARRQAGETDHVNGVRENAANLLDQAGRDIAAVPGQVGTWFDERGQDFNRWWNGTGEDRYVQVGTNENGPIYERQTDNGVRGQIADLPQNAANYVQRQMIDPVTNTVKTYLIDPVTNTAVAVGDFATNFANDVHNNVINPVRGAAQRLNQNVIQPAAKWTNENVIQPAAKWTNENVVQPVAEAADREYRYVQNSGDDASNRARETGVPANVVDGINREAANNGSSYQENLDTRSDMMSMLSVLRRNGSLSESEIQRMYANAQNSSNPLNSMYNDVLNAFYNQQQPRNYVRR